MRKKKLIEQIHKLEEENRRAKDCEDCWKDMAMRFTEGLHENGVEVEIVFPEPPKFEYAGEDGKMHYISGMTTEPPTLQFDFTEHDEAIKKGVAYETN